MLQVTKHTSEGIHPNFEHPGKHHRKSKIGVQVAPLKGLMFCKKIKQNKAIPVLFLAVSSKVQNPECRLSQIPNRFQDSSKTGVCYQ